MNKYWKVSFSVGSGRSNAFVQASCAGKASRMISSDFKSQGVDIKNINVEPVSYFEDMFTKSWAIEGMGLLKASKTIVEGKHAVHFTCESDVLKNLTEDAGMTLTLPEGADVNENWNNFDIYDAINLATEIYETLHKKMFESAFEAPKTIN